MDDIAQRLAGLGRRFDRPAQSGTAHDVAGPAQLDILLLQETVVGELGISGQRDAGTMPVPFHPQALRQRPVVQVFAVPAAPLGGRAQQRAAAKQQQEHINEDVLVGEVVVDRERDPHHARRACRACAWPAARVGWKCTASQSAARNSAASDRRAGFASTACGCRAHRAVLDVGAILQAVRVELGHVLERTPERWRQRGSGGERAALVAPDPLCRLQGRHGRQDPLRRLPRTRDLANQTFIAAAAQVHARAAAAFDHAGHHAVEEIPHHLGRAAQVPGVPAIPDRQQQMTVARNEHAGLGVLAIAL